MRAQSVIWPAMAAAMIALPTAASEGNPNVVKLGVAEVAAPTIHCVFSANFTRTVTERVGEVPLANLNKPNTAWLQSRTFTAAAGTPGAGKTGYEYRLDMTQASGSLECIGGIAVNFGPVSQL